ncbi:MAG: HEPN domain-containing protein [Candidatus Woesearchaeota archaeon]
MEKIKWRLSIKSGIELVEPNENLCAAYLKKSENSLRAAASLKDNREWEISSSYYAMYFALYAIMARIGIKCENHSCTIEFMKKYLSGHFTEEEQTLLKESMEARVDAQYYSDRPADEKLYRDMTSKAPRFLAKCREVIQKIKGTEMNSIRDELTGLKMQQEKRQPAKAGSDTYV